MPRKVFLIIVKHFCKNAYFAWYIMHNYAAGRRGGGAAAAGVSPLALPGHWYNIYTYKKVLGTCKQQISGIYCPRPPGDMMWEAPRRHGRGARRWTEGLYWRRYVCLYILERKRSVIVYDRRSTAHLRQLMRKATNLRILFHHNVPIDHPFLTN